MNDLPFAALLEKLVAAFPDDRPLHLVGGALRDALLGRVTHDFDFALPGPVLPAARRAAARLDAAFYPLDAERDTARLLLLAPDGTRLKLDLAAFRGADLEADLRGRDFTVNAMAFDLRARRLHDPLGGLADLREKRLRACSPTAFRDDPARVLRAVRLAAELGFTLEAETRAALRAAVPALGTVSVERLRDELFRILDGRAPAACLRALDVLNVLPHVLPELTALRGVEQPAPHVADVWEHTLALLDHLRRLLDALAVTEDPGESGDLMTGLLLLRLGRYRERLTHYLDEGLVPDRTLRALLFLAALYHDVAKPETRVVDEAGRARFFDHEVRGAEIAYARGQALRLSAGECERLRVVVRNHMRFHFHTSRRAGEGKMPSRRAIYRFFRDTGPAGVETVLLGLADLRATYGVTLPQDTWAAALDVARELLENWWERPEEIVAPPRLLDGDDLQRELAVPPGPRLGELLEAIREAQACGKFTDRAGALDFARAWLAEHREEAA